MALAYVPALLLAASGLTSRATRVGYAVRAMALGFLVVDVFKRTSELVKTR